MCLNRMGHFRVKQNYGWQCFATDFYGNLTSRFGPRDLVPLDKWQVDKKTVPIPRNDSEFYPTGFHVSLDRAGAENWTLGLESAFPIRQVYFRNIVAKGYQYNTASDSRSKIAVVRERYVCDKTDKPPEEP